VTVIDTVERLVAPILRDLDLELYDLDFGGGKLSVTVERAGGDAPAGAVDLDTIALVTRLLGRELDHADPIPGRYHLEVSSPGLERTLRTSAHFRRAVGETVAVRTAGGAEDQRRAKGELLAADDDGITVRDGDTGREERIAYADVERARTVFAWGPAPKPGKASDRNTRRARREDAAEPAEVKHT
jgi:ribosome maturation factor RimP